MRPSILTQIIYTPFDLWMHVYPSDMVLLKRMSLYNVRVLNTAIHTKVVGKPLENDIWVDINEYNILTSYLV